MISIASRRETPAFPPTPRGRRTVRPLLLLATLALLPSAAWACACGCGIFEVGPGSTLPEGAGGTAFVGYVYQDQNHNWSGTSEAPAADNPDKDIRTNFFTFGYQDMLNKDWGLRLEVPFEQRYFETVGNAPGNPVVGLNFNGVGDARIEGIYTGFSPGMTAGLTFGLKLPTGSFTTNDAYGDIDRDTELGSGSTDLQLGGFDRFKIDADYAWTGFVDGQLDLPVLTQAQYRPGAEFDAALGAYYKGWSAGGLLISPIIALKGSLRARDTGANATTPVASGYSRLLLAPGLQFDLHPWKVYADVERPLYQRFNGNQMAAGALYKVELSYMF